MLKKIDIFESSQVAFNMDFLSLIPKTVQKSALFIELAEELELGLTFCEHTDNGGPVLSGLWRNLLKAEKKLEKLLKSWEEVNQDAKITPPQESDVLDKSIMHVPLIVDSTGMPTPNSDVVVVSENHDSEAYFVASEIRDKKTPKLIISKPNENCSAVNTTVGHQELKVEDINKDSSPNNNEMDSEITKEIYVDISVDPTKLSKTISTLHSLRSSENQHSLDKLCQLLCIEDDEDNDVRPDETQHTKKSTIDDKLYYKHFCDQCSFKARRENHLVKHLLLHEKIQKLFYCDQCDFKTIRGSVLCRHKMHHSSTQLLCKLCPYKTNIKNFLLKHIRVKHSPTNRKKIKCSHCDYAASSQRDFKKHNKLLHRTENIPRFWKCSKCPYKSKLRAHLSRHENDVHSSLRQFLCHYCGKSFKRNDTLTQHKIIHGEVNKTFTCQTCGKVCTSSVIFKEHLASHTSERPFLCDVCGSSFKTRSATQRHKRSMHPANNTLLSCTQCGCIFKSRPDLNRHKKIHRCKAGATSVPAVPSGDNIQSSTTHKPITIQVVYASQLESNKAVIK